MKNVKNLTVIVIIAAILEALTGTLGTILFVQAVSPEVEVEIYDIYEESGEELRLEIWVRSPGKYKIKHCEMKIGFYYHYGKKVKELGEVVNEGVEKTVYVKKDFTSSTIPYHEVEKIEVLKMWNVKVDNGLDIAVSVILMILACASIVALIFASVRLAKERKKENKKSLPPDRN